MNRVRGIFNASVPATRAAIAALEDRDHVKKTVAHTLHWREWLTKELTALGLTLRLQRQISYWCIFRQTRL